MNMKKSSFFLIGFAVILIFIIFLHHWRPAGTRLEFPRHPKAERRNEVVRAIEQALPSVVNIGTKRVLDPGNMYEDNDFGILQRLFDKFLRSQKSSASYSLGSGCIIDPSGLIVTNAHVVERAAKITITLSGGQSCEAEIVADNPLNDIALLKLKNPPPGLKAIQCDTSGKLYLGETIIAVGNPFGLDSSITVGALSGTRRRFTYQGHVIFSDILQTDAMVYPGNSGGPLINIEGNMIGMNMSSYENAPGIGFAIPLSRIENILAKWMIPERFGLCSFGIIPEWKRDELGQRSIVVADVLPGSPAASAGIRKGMRLLRFDGQKVGDLLALSRKMIRLRKDDRVSLETPDGIFRLTVTALVQGNPLVTAREKLGLDLTPSTPRLARELGYPVDSGLLVASRLAATPEEVRRGDLLLKLDSSAIHTPEDLASKLKTLHYNDTVNAVFLTTVNYRGESFWTRKNIRLTVH